MRRRVVLPIIALTLAAPVVGRTASAPDLGRPFVPTPLSQPLYDVSAPTWENGQRAYIKAADETQLFIEAWLPRAKAGNVPPVRIPTVLDIAPYNNLGEDASPHFRIPDIVARGYAYAQAHVRGTGESSGCMDIGGPHEMDDAARFVRWVGESAFWSDGNVGLIGDSYDGGMAIAAATAPQASRGDYLKAVVAISPQASPYEAYYEDGVAYVARGITMTTAYHLEKSAAEARTVPEGVERASCTPEHVVVWSDQTGRLSPYFVERDMRARMSNVDAAMLMVHGHADRTVPSITQAGLFDQIPPGVPKAGIFGAFGHDMPDHHSHSGLTREWERTDWPAMVIAWFDRYLKGLDTGVETWPVAQVQGNDGQWRGEPDWPTTGGPVGQLALGPGGGLGTQSPQGKSTYVEGGFETYQTGPLQGTGLTFETKPLPARIELTGQPVLDLWVILDRPDAHIAARIETFDASGARIGEQRRDSGNAIFQDTGVTLGLRSLRHLEPLVQNRFVQTESHPPPVGVPIRVQVRLMPTDLVVPAGGKVRVIIAGSLIVKGGLEGQAEYYLGREGVPPVIEDPSMPSGAATRVMILHDCEHVSALRFLMPRATPDLLNVREPDERADQPLADNRPFVAPVSDAGGLATAPVCGQAPTRLENFGPEIP